MNQTTHFLCVLALICSTLISACATPAKPQPSLFDELGGNAGIEKLSEELIREIAADERLRVHYRDSDIDRFNLMMQQQMCSLSGGDCQYTGDNMKRTHGGMNITATEFNALVEAMMRAMDTRGLPVGVQNRMLALYAPMRGDIVGH